MAKRGSKMVKSEALQVRFDPILKWAAEIAAGRERRSLSSFLEWSTERLVKELPVVIKNGREITAWQIAEECWHPDPIWRLVRLASDYPETLTFDDRAKWQAVLLMVSLEQQIAPKTPTGGWIVDVEWLPAMRQVWPYIEQQSGDLDMVEVRARYLKARES